MSQQPVDESQIQKLFWKSHKVYAIKSFKNKFKIPKM